VVEKEIFLRMGNVDLALESMEKYQMVHDIFYFGQNKAKLNCKPNTKPREKTM
jgi:hypothetical protein